MIGRIREINELNRLHESGESEFVAIYGRRRVGKTYLVRETFADRFAFYHMGLPKGTKREQLAHFRESLASAGFAGVSPRDWFAAFRALREVVAASPFRRKIVFLDELPWMDTAKSGFLMALEAFWNEWASARKDILLIVCGSAASWMVKNLFRNRGGMHNRVTSRICLQPFTLAECEAFARDRGLDMSRHDIAECYMALGGIPYYWRYLARGRSLAQNIDRLCFAADAPLKGEFRELYSSLFHDAWTYGRIVAALATKKCGMTRLELLDALGVPATGRLSEALETLEASGFVRSYRSYGATKKNTIYQLLDPFTLFHFRFLDPPSTDECFWSSTSASHAQTVWKGLAFERLCLLHLRQIRKALGVGAIHVEAYGWTFRGNDTYPDGVQIDLVLDRADNVVNVCELKYSRDAFVIDKAYEAALGRKIATFAGVNRLRKAVHLTMVTASGLVHNAHSGRVQSVVTLDDLFAD
jgi:hypothetical protein